MQTHIPSHVARRPLFRADGDQFGGTLDTFPLITLLVIQVCKWHDGMNKSQVAGCAHKLIDKWRRTYSELFFLCFKEDDWMLEAIVISLITWH